MGGSPTRGAFTYTGRAFGELTGRSFRSVVEFCRAAGVSSSLVYGRVHAGWPLIKALDTPKLEMAGNLGRIYKVTRLSTGQQYVGLTVVSQAARWRQHIRSAKRRGSPLARAIADDGPDGFTVELVEEDIALDQLADRERHWIAVLGTLLPLGLNKHRGGALGGGNQREVEHAGETYRSVALASEALATRHGLTPAAAHQRLRKGKPLDAPLKVKRTQGKGVAGSFLWSRWRAMRNNTNSSLGEEWQDWDRFACDLAHLKSSDRLIRRDIHQPWGPENYSIISGSFINHPKVGTLHWTRWRSLLKTSNRKAGRGVVEEWREFDAFESDIAEGYFEGAVLVPIDWWQPWGPRNFRWGTKADRSRMVGRYGSKAKKHGEYKSRTYKRWLSMHNDARRNGSGVAQEWHDYVAFRDAVGDGVDRDLVLIRPDRSEPWGSRNFQLVTRDAYKATLGRFTHGATGTALHRRWSSMRANAALYDVGCDPSWSDFLSFAADVGEDRSGHDLERVDVSRGYGPDNFAWVNRAERRAAVEVRKRAKVEAAQEAREARAVTVRGVTYRGLYALAKAYGVPASTVCLRVRQGLTPEEAVLTPNKNVAAAKPVALDGRQFPSKHAALRYVHEQYGIRPNTMQLRMKSGLTLENAARKPPGRNSKQFRKSAT